MKEFKKGDEVRLIKYPEATGTVNHVQKGKFPMVWCWIAEDAKVPFGEPDSVELIPEK